ncbi:hypothetical protein [Streptomyces sp. MI02-7b]|uniref:hypothetical protein n=1 Tax=Streptomyces sp. MI02-7b TaxID=462941 RepID=UPI0029A6EEFB|nr:hypothetical protein [Streptomyces sp. MI02-7b]MDX3073597.1 hypothetical protein [Streptomyces sp. MI02-7b]
MTAAEKSTPRTCARCQKSTTDFVPFMVETGSGPGGMGVVCADSAACVSRAPAPRWTAPS